MEMIFILRRKLDKGVKTLPMLNNVLRDFYKMLLIDVRVVMLGQEPYKGIGKANGLSFFVNRGYPVASSLTNIFNEIYNEIEGFSIPSHGGLIE